MNKIKSVTGTFKTSFDYTECVNEMIEDGELNNEDEIRDYILECLAEDVRSINLTCGSDVEIIS
jgi:hypothetical protein